MAKGAVSQEDHDDASAALKHAEAEVEYWRAMMDTARTDFAYTRVTAPILGRVGKLKVT